MAHHKHKRRKVDKMGDSDDDYTDRKRRDKFRGERSEYRSTSGGSRNEDSGSRRSGNSGQSQSESRDWDREYSSNRGGGGNRRPIDYRLGNRMHEFSPPGKRQRMDNWGGPPPHHDRYDYPFYDGPPMHPMHPPPMPMQSYHPSERRIDRDSTSQLLSFKSWLSTQDDTISDQEALSKYAEYKQEYRRQELNEFFVAHKEEEWFKNKYHPDDLTLRKEENFQNLKKRVACFNEFLEKSRFVNVTLDSAMSDKIVKIMDWFVIRLEGGTDENAVELLEQAPKVEEKKKEEVKVEKSPRVKKESEKSEKEGNGEEENGPEKAEVKKDDESDGQESDSGVEDNKEKEEVGNKRKRSVSSSNDKIKAENGEEEDEEMGSPKDPKSPEKKEEDEKPKKPELPLLHRTSSIFLRNLAPSITKAEIDAMCMKHEGFMRVALADPQPERRWFRRGWVTFQRSVNIKEICWTLNNARLRDTELGPIVNKDLSRRVRTQNGITSHKSIVRNDLRLASKVIQHLDEKFNLWEEEKDVQKESYGVYSTNPVLKNITDFLIEEASAEEEELLGQLDADPNPNQNFVERDEELIAVLDRLLLYLRFVHSVDFYNHAEYPYEDDMPNRLGIIHARGLPPATKVNMTEIQAYNRQFEAKISTFMQPNIELTPEDTKALGCKDPDKELEKFISSNTQELGKDKWLCPLSGKKFKGPEFVRKHILNKHAEKLDEVKKEVIFFNNYLKDPRRPSNPDRNAKPDGSGGMGGSGGPPAPQPQSFPPGGMHGPPPHPPFYGGYGGGPMGPMGPGRYGGYGGGYGGGGGYNRNMGRPPYRGRDYGGSNRSMISYRDLDAPAEPDDF